jgi:hypothetical protein
MIKYLNTDLVVTSTVDLTNLVTAFESHDVRALYVTRGDDGLWYATFETDDQYDESEQSISQMLAGIESLSPADSLSWRCCTRREFNLGYDCGNEPWAFNQALSSELIGRLANVSASLRITLYPEGSTGS